MTEEACQISKVKQPGAEWMEWMSSELLVANKELPMGIYRSISIYWSKITSSALILGRLWETSETKRVRDYERHQRLWENMRDIRDYERHGRLWETSETVRARHQRLSETSETMRHKRLWETWKTMRDIRDMGDYKRLWETMRDVRYYEKHGRHQRL